MITRAYKRSPEQHHCWRSRWAKQMQA